jgi:hypothetical protein
MNDSNSLDAILRQYQASFAGKIYAEENDDHDALMDVFSLLPALKRENRQYWGRELGMCWQLIATQACHAKSTFQPALRIGWDEPCDFIVDGFAVDTKYRIGSGDSGTLKKFKTYGPLLKEKGFVPVFLILREDNLPAAISACLAGGWTVLTGQASFDFIAKVSGVDLRTYLLERRGLFPVSRLLAGS